MGETRGERERERCMHASGFERCTIPSQITPTIAFLIIFILTMMTFSIIYYLSLLFSSFIHSFIQLFKLLSFYGKIKQSRHTHPLVALVVSNPNRVFSGPGYSEKAGSLMKSDERKGIQRGVSSLFMPLIDCDGSCAVPCPPLVFTSLQFYCIFCLFMSACACVFCVCLCVWKREGRWEGGREGWREGGREGRRKKA